MSGEPHVSHGLRRGEHGERAADSGITRPAPLTSAVRTRLWCGGMGLARIRLTMALAALAVGAAGCPGAGEGTSGSPGPSPAATLTPPSRGTAADHARGSPAGQPGERRDGRTNRRMWVAVEDAGTIELVDLADRTVVATHRTGGGPHNLAVAADGTAAAALYATSTLALVRAGRLTTVDLGGRPHDVKPVGNRFVVANEAGRRVQLVTTGGQRAGDIPLEAEPHDLAVTADGRRAWVTLNGTDRLALVSLTAREVVRYQPTGQRPHDIRIAPDGSLWVTDWRGALHVLSPDGELVDTLRLGRETHHLAFTPDGVELWVVDHATRTVFVIDADARTVITRRDLPGAPHHVAVTPDGALAAVADHTNGTLVVFDTTRRRQVATIPVGAGPHGVWAAPPPAPPPT